MAMNPIAVVLVVAVAITLIGFVIVYLRSGATLRGYQEIARDAEAIAKKLRADTFRDGDDLVISGYCGKFPAVVRFSYSENTPGLNIQMKAPANFTLSVVPKGAKATEGRVLIKTTDEMFDARFATRTDQPTQARLFVSGKQAMAQLQKLCCSSKTFLTITAGAMELSELVIPDTYMGKHVSDHLDSMAAMAAALGAMPGADTVKITGYRHERSRVVQVAMAALVITGAVVVVSAMRQTTNQSAGFVASPAPEGTSVAGADAQRVLDADAWRVASSADFDPDGLAWLRGQHSGTVSGHLTAAFAGADKPAESAYVLVPRDPKLGGKRRVVLLADNKTLLDAAYTSVAIAAVVPHDNFPAITWQAKSNAPAPDGAALLLVRNAGDPKSALLLYSSQGKLATAAPQDYHSVVVE